MLEIARPRLLITLVHGTWPRGLFPKIARFKQWARRLLRRKRLSPSPFWFEEGSPFLDRLSTDLADIPHKIGSVDWSGANSIFVRDRTAHILAEHLSAEHADYPQATQLIIAHSHGGNIAIRALHHLKQRDASPSGNKGANPLVVTLATPFVEVHQADLGGLPRLIRFAAASAILLTSLIFAGAILPSEVSIVSFLLGLIFFAAFCFAVQFIVSNWLSGKGDARRQNQIERLVEATRLGEIVSPQAERLLIMRAIDDEASLVLALGTISSYVTSKAIRLVYHLMFIIVLSTLALTTREGDALKVVWSALILILLGLYSLARAAHGSELAKSPMECQVSTQSTPDVIGPSKIVTLVQRTFVRSLRHGIYDHDDCAKTISDWARSQLCALPPR